MIEFYFLFFFGLSSKSIYLCNYFLLYALLLLSDEEDEFEWELFKEQEEERDKELEYDELDYDE